MIRLVRVGMCTLLLALALGANAAQAQVEVALEFDRCFSSPGDQVALTGTVTNLASVPVVADLQIVLDVGGQRFGPVLATLPLAAGEKRTATISFAVPSLSPCTILSVTLTAAAGGTSAAATAMHGVLSNSPVNDDLLFRILGKNLIAAIGAEEVTAATPMNFGNLKNLYR